MFEGGLGSSLARLRMSCEICGGLHQVAICALVFEGDVILRKVDNFDQAKALFRPIKA